MCGASSRRARDFARSQFAIAAPELPTLEETLRLTQGRIQLDVELKETGCERDAIDLLLRYFPLGDFCITSFLAPALRETRAIHPGFEPA